jgi:hypothetical protein
MQKNCRAFFLITVIDQLDGEQPFAHVVVISTSENFLVVINRVDDAGWTKPVEEEPGAGANHCFDETRLGSLLDGAATPNRCLYAWASMTAASRECGCLSVTSILRAPRGPS